MERRFSNTMQVFRHVLWVSGRQEAQSVLCSAKTLMSFQYQMLSYEKQLQLKRNVVIKAYQHFSSLSESLVPEIGPTLPSPQQYGYRTKLTPHFDAPRPAMIKNNGEGFNIGFQQKGRRIVMDIEECPIGTPAINEQMILARAEAKRWVVRRHISRNMLS